MLEIAKILRAIDDLGRERAESFSGLRDEHALAQQKMSEISADFSAANKRIKDAKTSWLVATCDAPPDQITDLPQIPSQHAVVAVDGSQIFADKHEISLCYVINTSQIILYYGNGERPIGRTNPQLFYKNDDLFVKPYGRRQVRVTDKFVGIKRTVDESVGMADAIHAAHASGIPVVALWDGSLIRWELQNEPPDFKDAMIEKYLAAFDKARELGVPIAGYISDPGSNDFVNSMRIMLCDQKPIDCDACIYKERNEIPPCDAIARLKDSTFWAERLKGGKRTVMFTSSSSILEKYGEHKVRAFYMDVGREVARIEVPLWVAADESLLNLVHAVCHDQSQKGRGYPVALSEAHERAVIRGPERAAFWGFVERSFAKHGAKINFSLKRISKGY